jgi:oxygen-independent coproporphyrinogen-3 oxidase
MKHLYVHIPFCRSRCAYCDFASEPVGPHARAGRVDRYVEALRVELAERLGPAGAPVARGHLQTIYLGGGTPTVLPRELLLDLVRDLAGRLETATTPVRGAAPPPAPGAAASSHEAGAEPAAPWAVPAACSDPPLGGQLPEFTVEANPGTNDADLLAAIAEAGVTRLSLGVQSFSPVLLTALGRRVTQREVEEALRAVHVTGWREWNLDLVFGIPGQTWAQAAADIDAAVAAGPTHISMYDLTYTPTYLAHVEAAARGRPAAAAPLCVGLRPGGADDPALALTDQGDLFADTYFSRAVARLQAAGYRRYEVSNFALPGHECNHNLAYWRGADYLGVGAAAVSTIGHERRANPRSVAGYLRGDRSEIEALTTEVRLFEKAMLGLRTIEGVDESEVGAVLDPEARERLLRQGCLEGHCGKLRLNTGFLDVSNAVISALLVHPGGTEAGRHT